MPLPGRFLTSVLLRREGDLLLFDCGEGTQVALRQLNLRWKKISTIFISHTHADHVTGLPGILMLSAQVDRTEPLVIVGPPKVREYVNENRRILDMFINYDIVFRDVTEAGPVFFGEGYTVKAFRLNHTKPCYGYSLEEDPRPGVFYPEEAERLGVPRGPAWSVLQQGGSITLEDGRVVESAEVLGRERPGRKFSFVTDTTVVPEIAAEVAGSDLFICEGMFLHELAESAADKKHLTAVQAAELANMAGGIKNMGLIHYSPRYTRYDLKQLVQEAREIFPDTFLTKDGQLIEIPYV